MISYDDGSGGKKNEEEKTTTMMMMNNRQRRKRERERERKRRSTPSPFIKPFSTCEISLLFLFLSLVCIHMLSFFVLFFATIHSSPQTLIYFSTVRYTTTFRFRAFMRFLKKYHLSMFFFSFFDIRKKEDYSSFDMRVERRRRKNETRDRERE